jgi:tetratricopeptide (TPR) repeat protein/TolB-like protein
MTELRLAWGSAKEGASEVVVVEGDAGIGKTLLCEELAHEILAAGECGAVLRGRWREGSGRGSRALAEMLAPLASAPGLGGASDASLSELGEVVPRLRVRFSGLAPPTGYLAELSAAVHDVVGVVAEEEPVVLLVDDAAHMDEWSATALDGVLRAPPPGTLLLVAVRRISDAPHLVSRLPTARGRRHLTLGPLGGGDLDALLASMLELAPDDRRSLAARLRDECGGNPLYATELVWGLVDAGLLAPDTRGVWRMTQPDLAALALPRGLRGTLLRRFDTLSVSAARLASQAAEMPEPVDATELRAATGLARHDFEAALTELFGRRLLRELPGHPDLLEYVHPIARRVAREDFRPGTGGAPDATTPDTGDPRGGPSQGGVRAAPVKEGVWPRGRVAWLVTAALVLAFGAIAAVTAWWPVRVTSPATPLLAIGAVEDLREERGSEIAPALSDMLATNLARIAGLQVVSTARMYELQDRVGSPGDRRAGLTRAARQAGADQLLEGSILSRGEHLRFDLRRVDLRTGAVLHASGVEGVDAFDLVDRATAAVVAGMGLRPQPLRLADATTASMVAYRFYEEGLRRFAGADYRSALQLFEAAETEDSTFVLAAYYAWQARDWAGQPTSPATLARVRRLAQRAPDRDRLLIEGSLARALNEPRLAAVADTLAIRYPAEPEGRFLLGMSRFWEGMFDEALESMLEVVAMDSLGLEGERARCLACDALSQIVEIHVHSDALSRAVEAATGWVDRQPRSARAQQSLAAALLYGGRTDEAVAARARAVELNPIDARDAVFPAIARIYAGEYGSADGLLSELGRGAAPDVQREALWFLAISLRYQGRLVEALEVLRRLEPLSADPARPVQMNDAVRRHEAQVLFEMGRHAEAETLLEALLAIRDPEASTSADAGHRAFNLTQLASAAAAAADTSALELLADSTEALGLLSASGRDRRLHHHIRGLLARARGDLEGAAVELDAAIYSLTSGFTRTNLELGRLLVELGRPEDAVSVLEPALRSPLEASNLYVSRTELRATLGTAHDAAGNRQRAIEEYGSAAASWSAADPPLRARAQAMLERITALGG